MEPRPSRGRRYGCPRDHARFGPYALYVAWLDEARERLADLVADVPQDVGNLVPDGGENSIWWLCQHLVWGERHWLAQVSGQPPLPAQPAPGTALDGAAILATLPALQASTAVCLAAHHRGELAFVPAGPFASLEPVLEHLCWHWTYHSGQVGLLRRLVGPRYRWTFEPGADRS